jgi:chromosome segregation ATPase
MHGNGTSRNPTHWKLREANKVARECETLKTQLALLHTKLTDKEGHVSRLRFLLSERLRRIDDLNGKLEQARAQIRKLDGECEHLAELVKG